MAATVAQIAQVRRMVNESTADTYDDAAIAGAIESYAVMDARGVQPLEFAFNTSPPTASVNAHWIPTYDLNAAAAEIWDEKAAAVACNFDFSADGASYSRSQVVAQYSKMAAKYRSMASPGSLRGIASQRALSPTGVVVEVTPIIDRHYEDGIFNN